MADLVARHPIEVGKPILDDKGKPVQVEAVRFERGDSFPAADLLAAGLITQGWLNDRLADGDLGERVIERQVADALSAAESERDAAQDEIKRLQEQLAALSSGGSGKSSKSAAKSEDAPPSA